MGLDNGIDFKILDKEKFGEIPAWIKREEWEEKYGFDYEMLYWRKCWNVRQEILIYLGSSDDEYEWVLDLNDLQNIFKILKGMYKQGLWTADYECGMTIWSWDDIRYTYPRNLKYAKRVAKWLATKPKDSYEIKFYDSY